MQTAERTWASPGHDDDFVDQRGRVNPPGYQKASHVEDGGAFDGGTTCDGVIASRAGMA